jgi:hypothetical protein
LVVPLGEDRHDAVTACFVCGARRSASFGRAPVIYDMEWAFTLWGFLAGAPSDLVETREPLFRSASHHYQAQRIIADCVPESTLRLTPLQVAETIDNWRSLLELPAPE